VKSVAIHDDIIGVKVSMVLAQAMDTLDPNDERMEKMECLKRAEFPPRLSLQELTEKLSFDILRYENGDGMTPKGNRLLGMVLNENGTGSQLVELSRIKIRGLVTNVSLGKKQLGGALDLRVPFPDSVDFSLPARTELGHHFVFSSDDSTRLEIESVNGNVRFRRHRLN
jgi:hypothetical protein